MNELQELFEWYHLLNDLTHEAHAQVTYYATAEHAHWMSLRRAMRECQAEIWRVAMRGKPHALDSAGVWKWQ